MGVTGSTGNFGPTGPMGNRGPTGTSETLITFNPAGNYISYDFQFFGTQNSTESFAQIVMSKPGYLSNLYVSNNGTNNENVNVIIRVNGQNTPLYVDISGGVLVNWNNVAVVPVRTGDKVSVLYQSSKTNLTYGGSISFIITS